MRKTVYEIGLRGKGNGWFFHCDCCCCSCDRCCCCCYATATAVLRAPPAALRWPRRRHPQAAPGRPRPRRRASQADPERPLPFPSVRCPLGSVEPFPSVPLPLGSVEPFSSVPLPSGSVGCSAPLGPDFSTAGGPLLPRPGPRRPGAAGPRHGDPGPLLTGLRRRLPRPARLRLPALSPGRMFDTLSKPRHCQRIACE